MDSFEKIVRIGSGESGYIFAKIKYSDSGRLSISGVEGPRPNGDCRGSAGQILSDFKEYDSRGRMTLNSIVPADGWDSNLIRRFFDVWDRWHLNDMRAGCAHQVGPEWEGGDKIHLHPIGILCRPCETCGYKWGTAWLREEVPEEVLEFLRSLPDTDRKPAWV